MPENGNDKEMTTLRRAAQYVRMSTDHQKYSTENQADIIAAYAAERGFEIVRTYADEGRSGLNIAGRDALQQLIGDVRSGAADYQHILVYDVSRWGRFDDLLPLRQMTPRIASSRKYGRIKKSILAIGLVEPLAVAKADKEGRRMLLDGHLRYHALREHGIEEARCIVADDDDTFTYNKRVNRLATVQEHYMILRAIERGASEEKIAQALGINKSALHRRKTLLSGISPEVANLLKDKNVNSHAFDVLRKMKPLRQIEAAELMISVNNFTLAYAKAILAATKQSDLTKPDQPKKIDGMTPEQMARMERELESLNRDFKAVEETYGDDVLQLVLASRYLGRLVENENIQNYLTKYHPDILAEFQVIIGAASLEQMGST